MNWIKDVLSEVKAVVLAPITGILCVAGVLLLLASFAEYSELQGLSLQGTPHWIMFGSAWVLVLFGVALHYSNRRQGEIRSRIDYERGVQLKRGNLTISIKTGEIQAIRDATRNDAIILPANTTFVDDCAADKRTAMGAFFTEHFPLEVATLPQLLKEVLGKTQIRPERSGQYAPGTTVLLPDRFARPAWVIVTASTIRKPGAGSISSPPIICKCVERILRLTADLRVNTLYIPILGSGHGGVDRGLALLFLILAMLHYSTTSHHVTMLRIVVHPRDVEALNNSKELEQILALP